MKILAVDTSSPICSVCISEDDKIIKEISSNDGNTHSVKLMPQISQVLSQNNLKLTDIDLFVCDKGPGSFTGIRIGISTIKAFGDVTNIPAIGISSLMNLAYTSNFDGYICSLIDAKNNNVYYGLFEHSDGKYIQIGDYLSEDITCVTEILKNCNKPIFFVGNGSIVYKDMLESSLKENAIINNENQYTDITSVSLAKLAYYLFSSGEYLHDSYALSPLYLKKSSAERELEERKVENNN